MTLKSIVLAGATLAALTAPAAASAQAYWDHDRGYHDGYRDRDDWRRDEWRRDWRRHEWYAHSEFRHRCFIENRGYYAWNGRYVSRPVEVCR